MASPAPPPRRGAAERAAAWLFVGPLGHLWSTVADLTVFAAQSLEERARRRLGRDPAVLRRFREGA